MGGPGQRSWRRARTHFTAGTPIGPISRPRREINPVLFSSVYLKILAFGGNPVHSIPPSPNRIEHPSTGHKNLNFKSQLPNLGGLKFPFWVGPTIRLLHINIVTITPAVAINPFVTRSPMRTTNLLATLTGVEHFIPIWNACLTGYF